MKNMSKNNFELTFKSFHYNWRKWNISSDEDSTLTMNQILENLFSMERFKRKAYLITRKGKKVAKKVNKVADITIDIANRKSVSIQNVFKIQSNAQETANELPPDYLQKIKANKLKYLKNLKNEEDQENIEMSYLDLEEDLVSPKGIHVKNENDLVTNIGLEEVIPPEVQIQNEDSPKEFQVEQRIEVIQNEISPVISEEVNILSPRLKKKPTMMKPASIRKKKSIHHGDENNE
jgi:uncharacterized pyridoxamine 5'-phosphate oxidase family protein